MTTCVICCLSCIQEVVQNVPKLNVWKIMQEMAGEQIMTRELQPDEILELSNSAVMPVSQECVGSCLSIDQPNEQNIPNLNVTHRVRLSIL